MPLAREQTLLSARVGLSSVQWDAAIASFNGNENGCLARVAGDAAGRTIVCDIMSAAGEIPPADVIQSACFEVAVGGRFDLSSLSLRCGQATRWTVLSMNQGEVISLTASLICLPAGGNTPMRCYLSENGIVRNSVFTIRRHSARKRVSKRCYSDQLQK